MINIIILILGILLFCYFINTNENFANSDGYNYGSFNGSLEEINVNYHILEDGHDMTDTNHFNSNTIYDTDLKNGSEYKKHDNIHNYSKSIDHNSDYFTVYNKRNTLHNNHKGRNIHTYGDFLTFLYPNSLVKYCKEGYTDNCFKVIDDHPQYNSPLSLGKLLHPQFS